MVGRNENIIYDNRDIDENNINDIGEIGDIEDIINRYYETNIQRNINTETVSEERIADGKYVTLNETAGPGGMMRGIKCVIDGYAGGKYILKNRLTGIGVGSYSRGSFTVDNEDATVADIEGGSKRRPKRRKTMRRKTKQRKTTKKYKKTRKKKKRSTKRKRR